MCILVRTVLVVNTGAFDIGLYENPGLKLY